MTSAENKTFFRTIQKFKTDYSRHVFSQYESERTGMTVVVVDEKGPKVRGFFAVATEIHDDSGAPHTLEHLIFMGSKSYKYKGVLDRLGTRAYSVTNAWTATDHTAYTLDTAGWDGFAQILPVYLEHVLLPTLTDAGCYTEVHHVDGAGNDAGVVYSEMQGHENEQDSVMDLRARRLLYPENVGFRYETGGMLEQLRVLTADRIRAFHKEMYQPKNLCLVILGEVQHEELLQILDRFEGQILDDIPRRDAAWKRPWVESPPTPALQKSVVETIEFPEEDESSGQVMVAFLGPDSNNTILTAALDVILVYLAGSSISVLENTLVEKEHVTSAVYYNTDHRPDAVIWLTLASVATERLSQVERRLFELLKKTASEPLDMPYLLNVIRREKRRWKASVEQCANPLSDSIITDFLFGKKDGSTLRELETLGEYDKLEEWSDRDWRDFLSKWMADAHHVSVLGVPSAKMAAKIKADEEARVEEQKRRLGEEGLKELDRKLKDAKAQNDVEVPRELLESFPIPSTDSIHFIETTTARAGLAGKAGDNSIQKIIDEDQPHLPLFLQFEHIPSQFVVVTIMISVDSVPMQLRPLIPVFLDNFFNTPVMRDGKRVEFEQVVSELEKDTVAYYMADSARLGNPETLQVWLKVEPEKYEVAIKWLKEMLWSSIFDEERLKASVIKQLADVPEEKRDGNSMTGAVNTMIHYSAESTSRACNTLVKALYLKRVKRLLEREPGHVKRQMEEVRAAVCRPENMRVLVIADVEKLKSPVSGWKPFLEGLDTGRPLAPLCRPRDRLSAAGKKPGELAYVVPMPAIDSSYSKHTARGPASYDDPQQPALMVALAYLDAVEGPLWCAVRGTGLAYGTGFRRDTRAEALQFIIYSSPDAYKAFKTSKKVVEDLISGATQFDPPALEGAISSIVVRFAEEGASMEAAAYGSFTDQVVREVPRDYNEQTLRKVRAVGVDELKAVLREVVLPVFVPGTSDVVVTCAPVMEEGIIKGFEEDGFKVQKKPLAEFQDDYGLKGGEDEEDDDEEDDEDDDDDEDVDDDGEDMDEDKDKAA
ncbi:MAG: hypothetical protein M1832_003230 [Thelocarpon impressellum]|nr:MAG: hypothetical protein M1832_003230 [Thelocarpon impressellum]